MGPERPLIKAEQRRTIRTFGIGAACGFVAGAALVAVLITKYSHGARTPAAGPAGSVSSDDGLADLDAPILEERPRLTAATSGTASGEGTPVLKAAPPEALTHRKFAIPVEGVKPDQLVRSFEDRRSGTRAHEALDILAPRNTPVRAIDDGTIARLFESKAGGTTIYQFDPTEQFCYYYAHLERYVDGLREGDQVKKGQIIGYVGTSGNAPKNTPHLHFAIFKLTSAKRWWEGTPIDPYDILR
jgi:murein DD-endopeptidase MepM/ murein hydrolase activator NlpD